MSHTPIVDFAAHCHVHEPDRVDYDVIDRDLGSPVYADVEAYARYYDELGVEGGVLSQTYYMGLPDVELVAAANDTLVDAVAAVEGFHAMASLPTAAGGEAAAAEFERCLDRGVSCAGVETRSGGVELHHDELAPVFAVADRTGAPVFVHPTLNDSLRSPDLDDAWLLNAVFGRDVALAASLSKVVNTGVLDRYPDLHLVYHHLGGNVSSALGRVRNQFEQFSPEGWLGEAPAPYKPWDAFRGQLEERVFVDTSGYDGTVGPLRNTLATFPASQLLFGTDFPYETRTREDVAAIVEPIREETSRADARRILGGNALDLLVNVD